ncbi:hypothetical protein LOTGIDRAFT_166177 [Lottia gigantea]|uniref:Uncharacterized protein n=1 Tax=Lottia gigantea TaxID=225164 RepID=V4BH73_LOTGI|nr:hypothetical protein LOTGIDRAFT_166177 [Lottia gigantea]ESO87874.1 hypothetical protein LOTGIDRAFT_166177 [Lottia gigantea]
MNTENNTNEDDVKKCKELISETTAHGCRNIMSNKRSNFIRFLWLCYVIGMGITLFATLYMGLENYWTYPFNTVLKIGPQPKLKFPMVTICDLTYLRVNRFPNPEAVRKVFLRRSILNSMMAINESDKGFIEVTNTPLDEAHTISNVTVDDIFQICIWKGQTVSCNEMWIPLFTDLGKCFVLNDSLNYYADSDGSHGGLNFIAKIDQEGYIVDDNANAGLKIKLHDPHEDPRISDSGIYLNPGGACLMSVNKKSYTFLPEPFKAYGDEYCVVNSELSGQKSKPTSIKYDRESCIRSCVVIYVIKGCNCRSVTDSEFLTYPMCTIGQWLNCYEPSLRIAYTRNISQYNCTCPRVCEFNVYQTKLSLGMFPSVPALEILQKLNIIKKKSGGRYSWRTDGTVPWCKFHYSGGIHGDISFIPVV